MFLKKKLLFIFFLSTLFFLLPQKTMAANFSSGETILTKVQEAIQYFFTFKVENKIQVLENNAEKRLTWAGEYANAGDEEKVKNMIQNYQQIKERQENLLGTVDGEVLGAVAERTIEQQEKMEKLKVVTSDTVDNWIVDTQENVVNGVAQRIVVTNGIEGQTEFFQKVERVWAPGTGPGGEAGVVVEGGKMQFAPGTSGGGPATSDIKTVEVKTGGGENSLAPGTTAGDSGSSGR